MKGLIQNQPDQERAVKQFLRNYLCKEKNEQTLNTILEEIGGYYDADRAYIFELDDENRCFNNTFEWCREGVKSEIDNLQNISTDGLEVWFEAFEEKGEFYISSLSEDFVPGTKTYEILEPQGVESLMASPILVNDVLLGFLGVDNPKRHTEDLLLLSVAASTCYCEIAVERKAVKNKEQYNKLLVEEKQLNNVIGALANVYISIDYIELETKKLRKVMSQDPDFDRYNEEFDAKKIMDIVVDACVAESYRPIVKTFLDVDTIDERLGDNAIISQTFMDLHGRWQRASFVPVIRGENGKNLAVLCNVRNVHNEVEAIKTQDNLIQALAIPYENTYAIDGNTGNAVCYNMSRETEKAFGRKFEVPNYEDTLGFYRNNVVFEDDRHLFDEIRFLPQAVALLSEKMTHSFVYRLVRNDKMEYYQCMMVMPDSARKDFVVAFRNVSDEKRLEIAQQWQLEKALVSAEEANRAKTDFLFNMSHDIRTPMNAIMGFRDLLEKYQDDPEKRQDYLNKIKTSEEVLLSIINNVLEMTRIEQGAIEVDETPAGVEQFTDGIESMFGGMMEAKGIEFIADIRVKHMFVYCDVGKTRELFMNVLSNACKFTNPGGKVKMILEEFPGESNDRVYFRTTISDTGIGMEEEFIPHMFDAFARENNTTDAKVEGTGLGMPIVKRLVDLMHGTIDVKSKKDFGTQVTITIPHRIAKEEDCLTQVDKTIDPELFRGRRILLAEDNDLNAEIAIEILREAGFIIEHAGDGKECYDMLTSADDDYYDIVLMDIQMPNMNGYEAAVAIRKMHSKKKSEIPIVAMTANAFEEDKKEAFRCGMNGHIAKPINVKNVLEQLARIIRQKQ